MDDSSEDGDRIYRKLSAAEAFIISSQKIKKAYEKMWSETRKVYDLTQNEIDIILFLKNHEDMDTAADISRYRSMSRSQVCKSVEDLTEAGYLTSLPDRQDRRYLHLKLTENAGSVLDELQKLRKWFWDGLQEEISREEVDTFLSVLGKMRVNLDRILPDLESVITIENERGVEDAGKGF